ncbi:MAG: hypothetical protein ACRDG8_08975 [Actinomycetota bacterium]
MYLKLMGDPKNYRLRDNIAASTAIAADAEVLGDPVTEGEALLRAGRLLGDVGQTSEGALTVARARECSIGRGSRPRRWRSSRP